MTERQIVTRRFNVNVGQGWKTTSVLFTEGVLALVRLKHSEGRTLQSRFDMGKGIYIDPPVISSDSFSEAARDGANRKTHFFIARAHEKLTYIA